ncbi:hypothetical protein [Stenotrophomonas sp. 24(2023)]|uniref:hypothetical protein n=1 Tax=Stenotrophomonas sp. 24(2023) TaxID=3068324 RepID=UPI0027E030FD|nr:hypothetical protein [Stenotrophomonas sp. 24(2023)]WMJ71337.1 hypothetical protein Q9R17_09650 [Stenotrophomonas sp. 24(2023)]
MVVLFMAMGCVPAHADTCRVQVSTDEDHSSISQNVMVRVERAIEASTRLSLALHEENYDVAFRLVSAPSERPRDVSAATPFRLFFVLIDRQGKLLFADAPRCSDGADACVVSVMRNIGQACGSTPNRSFKAKPLHP